MEATEPAITSFFMRTPVNLNGKGEDQIVVGDDAKSKKSTARKDKREAEKTGQVELSSAKDVEPEDEVEHIPFRQRTRPQP